MVPNLHLQKSWKETVSNTSILPITHPPMGWLNGSFRCSNEQCWRSLNGDQHFLSVHWNSPRQCWRSTANVVKATFVCSKCLCSALQTVISHSYVHSNFRQWERLHHHSVMLFSHWSIRNLNVSKTLLDRFHCYWSEPERVPHWQESLCGNSIYYWWDKRDKRLQRRWERKSSSCISIDLRLTELYLEVRLSVMTRSTKVAFKPSCRDRGATSSQSKCKESQPTSESTRWLSDKSEC